MVDLIFIVTAVLIPMILSGLLSGIETAITAMSIAKLHKLKTDGNKRAYVISKLREDKENLISAILLANNAFNIFASTMATAFLINAFGEEGVVYATILMTVLVIVFVEVLPKTYAIANPERVALSYAYFLKFTVMICLPIAKAINKVVEYIMDVCNLNHPVSNLVSPTEEIKGAIDLHHKEGSFDQSDKYMLDGVFYLGETHIREVMTHRKNMQSLNLDLTVQEIITQLKTIAHTRIPVWREKPENIIGILNTRDLYHAILEQPDVSKLDIRELVVEPMFVHENTPLDEQLAEFKARKTRIAVVIDEYGDIQGIITLADILEEIVGRIHDEHDKDKNDIILNEDHCLVKGEVTIRDLNRLMNWSLPDEEASTIAGLLIHKAEHIPEVNEKLEFYGFVFDVIAKDNNQLTSIKIMKIDNKID